MQIQFDTPKARFSCSTPQELGGQTSLCDTGGTPLEYISGLTVLEDQGLNDLPWYVNLIVLLGFGIVARVLAYYSLRKNSRRNKE